VITRYAMPRPLETWPATIGGAPRHVHEWAAKCSNPLCLVATRSSYGSTESGQPRWLCNDHARSEARAERDREQHGSMPAGAGTAACDGGRERGGDAAAGRLDPAGSGVKR
jgi:hypothetical protein